MTTRRAGPGTSAPVFIMGPTAAGKTALALALAERLGAEIVSVDSALVYRGMDIGTGKPAAAELAAIPHHLIDIRDPRDTYSAAEFARDATCAIAAVRSRSRMALLAGGTGLYFRALSQGLSPLPAADSQVRARLDEEARAVGWPAMHERLASLDPAAAARIHPNDPQRIQRALEVHALTGRAMSDLLALRRPVGPSLAARVLILEPPDRVALHRRIQQRFEAMLRAGFVDEVATLRERGRLAPGMPALRAVGYRQVWAHLEGEIDRATMIERAVAATRQLARRQLTWLRREPATVRLDPMAPDLVSAALRVLGPGSAAS